MTMMTTTKNARHRRRCDVTTEATSNAADNDNENILIESVVRCCQRRTRRNEVSRSREVPCAQPISGHGRDLESRLSRPLVVEFWVVRSVFSSPVSNSLRENEAGRESRVGTRQTFLY
jgi:hypothetical protein